MRTIISPTPPSHPGRRARGGVALVTALGVLLVIGILVAGTLVTTQVELGITRNDATATQAQYAAEAGLQAAKATLFQYYRWIEDYYEPDDDVGRAACFSRLGSGIDLDRDGTFELAWNGDRIELITDGTVTSASGRQIGSHDVTLLRDGSGRDIYTLESRGSSNGSRATVRSTVLLDNTGVLEQALFTGVGQANKHLNGGATIRGGVYVVGEQSAPDTSVIDANGNFALYNDYDLTQSTYGGIAQRVTSENHSADNLCATLRVQYGEVSFSGSVQLGDPDNDLLGVFVGDEASDLNNGIGDCSGNKGICSDDIGTFDIDQAEAPGFPVLDGPPDAENCFEATWRACIDADGDANGITLDLATLGSSATLVDFTAMAAANGVIFDDPASCFAGFSHTSASLGGPWLARARGIGRVGAVALVARLPAAGDALAAGRLLTADHKPKHRGSGNGGNGGGGGTGSKGNNNTNLNPGWTLTLDQDVDCTATKFYNSQPVEVGFEYTHGSTGDLEVFGAVNLKAANLYLPGDVEYYAQTQSSSTASTQNASIAVQADGSNGGDMLLRGSLLTGTDGSFDGFPDHVLALIAEDDLVAEGSFTMAPMYAGDAFRTVKDRVIIGSVVSNTFCTTSSGGDDKCNAGQKAEIVYVNTGNNKPDLLRFVESAGTPLFEVLSYEVR